MLNDTQHRVQRLKQTMRIAVISLGAFAVMTFASGHAFADDATSASQTPAAVVATTILPDPTQPSTTATDPAPTMPAPAAATTTASGDGSAASDTSAASPASSSSSSSSAPSASDAGSATAATSTQSSNDASAAVTSPEASAATTTTSNSISSAAQSGNATVANNGAAGNATSGNAQAAVTAIVSSGSSIIGGQSVATFVVTVPSNTNGDIFVDPAALAGATTATANVGRPGGSNTTTTIAACATSGNATVAGNGTAGSATTGNADAEANLITLADSSVSTPQFFVGVVTVYGDLNGNVVLPTQFGGAALAPTVGQSQTASNVSVANTVTASAQSGNATVSNNGSTGNATSGNTATAVNECTLAGGQLVGNGIVIIFVNVLGRWNGFVMNGPAAAMTMVGTADANETIAPLSPNGAVVSITNNVHVAARTGDALVKDNGTAGNATTGNAMSSVSLFNLVASNVHTTGWFGVLFINVFGDWIGGVRAVPADASTTTPPPAPQTPTPILRQSSPGRRPNGVVFASHASFAAPHMMVAQAQSPSAVLGVATPAPGDKAISAANTTKARELTMLWWVIGALAAAEAVVAIGYIRKRIKENKDAPED